jgi:iron complex transport system ATP-binding protein
MDLCGSKQNEAGMAVQIKGISHAYRELPVLRHLDVHVRDGEFFIIIGPNGSGKTTLLKTLCGIEPLQRGEIHIFGRSIRHYTRNELAKTLSFVPQTVPEDFPFSVFQTVLMGRYPHLGALGVETKQDLEIARRAIDFCGITPLAGRKMNELSGGERQRVFIARALCQDPRLIILDEPTASLDLSHQVRTMDLMEKLKEEKGLTVVMVSHDVNLAAMYADRLLLMKSGEVAGIGPPREVLTFEVLEKVYRCTILVDESPLGAAPRITLVPRRFMAAAASGTPDKRPKTVDKCLPPGRTESV